MAPLSTLSISVIFLFILSVTQASLNLYSRKPILTYLVRYRLGQIKAKLRGHHGHFGHSGYGPGLFNFGHTGYGLGHHGLGHHGHHGLGHPGHLGYGHSGLGHITGPGPVALGHSGPGPLSLGHSGPGLAPIPLGHSGPGPISLGHNGLGAISLGHTVGKVHGGHDGPEEEHIHHYYIEPLPYAAKPLAPPAIHPNGHSAHSYFSLQSHGADIKYNHYFDLPKPGHK